MEACSRLNNAMSGLSMHDKLRAHRGLIPRRLDVTPRSTIEFSVLERCCEYPLDAKSMCAYRQPEHCVE